MAPVQPSGSAAMVSFEYRNSIPFWDAFTQTACIGVSIVCVGMRVCSKFVLMSMSGWDDCMLCSSVRCDSVAKPFIDTCLLAWVS